MIPTFLLSHSQKNRRNVSSSGNKSLLINPENFTPRADLYSNLKAAIVWAINNDEDIILCALNESCLQELNVINTGKVLRDIVSEGIDVVYLQIIHKHSIIVNKDIEVALGIQEINSFILMRPSFKLVLYYLEEREKNFADIDWVTFMTLINPYYFKLSIEKKQRKMMVSNKIHVISPFRNAAGFIKENWTSIEKQEYSNYHVYYIDDASDVSSLSAICDRKCITKKLGIVKQIEFCNFASNI